jgi:hypothetical protein
LNADTNTRREAEVRRIKQDREEFEKNMKI